MKNLLVILGIVLVNLLLGYITCGAWFILIVTKALFNVYYEE